MYSIGCTSTFYCMYIVLCVVYVTVLHVHVHVQSCMYMYNIASTYTVLHVQHVQVHFLKLCTCTLYYLLYIHLYVFIYIYMYTIECPVLHVIWLLFYRKLLPSVTPNLFCPWVLTFSREVIAMATQYPLVSGFYKLLACVLRICKRTNYFKVS